jgi:hypothetical protein
MLREKRNIDKELPYLPSEPCWEESIQAIKDSLRFNSFDSFRKYLINTLPQNSYETRERNFSYITKRFFPNQSLDQLTVKVWKYYKNEELLKDIMRFQFTTKERLVSMFIENGLILYEPGSTFTKNVFESFVSRVYNAAKPKAVARLSYILCKLGFITRKGKEYFVLNLGLPKSALVILVHHIFAPTPTTVALKEILANSFWKYLGIKKEDQVRQILKEAFASGLLAKYIIADQLEQITTEYSLDDFLKKRLHL